MKFKRIMCLAIVLITLFSVLASCKTGEQTDETVTLDAEEVSTDADGIRYDANGYQMDNLPGDINYNGKEINIFGWTRYTEFGVEDEGGDLISMAVMKRNLRVQERFGVKLVWFEAACDYNAQGDWVTKVLNNASAGDEQYDLVAGYSMTGMTLALQGVTTNLLDCEYLDFDAPWWPSTLIEQNLIGGKLYSASGDIARSYYEQMYLVLANKDLFEEYKIQGDPIQDVKDGTWTLEKMLTYAAQVTRDSQGNGKDVTDTYGLALISGVQLDAFVAGSNFDFIATDSKGNFVIGPDLETVDKVKTFQEKLAPALHTQNFGWYGDNDVDGTKDMIKGERALFAPMTIDQLGTFISDNMDFLYYTLPSPKYDENQKEYSTGLGFEYSMYAIPNTNTETDVAALVMEALASEGYRNTTPALYETKIKYRYSGDEPANVEMFDILRSTTYFDTSRFLYKLLEDKNYNPCSKLRYGVGNNSTTLASTFASLKPFLKKYLEKDLTKNIK